MTNGRGGSKSGRGGRGNSGRGGGRGGRGQNYTSASNTVKKGLCSNLGGNVFDYGQNNSADQMRTSWEKLTQYVGITYGLDICNELTNKAQVTLSEPGHTQVVMDRHKLRDAMVRSAQRNMKAARESQLSILEATGSYRCLRSPSDYGRRSPEESVGKRRIRCAHRSTHRPH
jgi:hypothetical protein